MSEECVAEKIEVKECEEACKAKVQVKKKRDIFRFNGQEDMAINLEHVNKMVRNGNKITFQFSETADFVEFEDEEYAKKSFEVMLNVWAQDVVE